MFENVAKELPSREMECFLPAKSKISLDIAIKALSLVTITFVGLGLRPAPSHLQPSRLPNWT